MKNLFACDFIIFANKQDLIDAMLFCIRHFDCPRFVGNNIAFLRKTMKHVQYVTTDCINIITFKIAAERQLKILQ